MTTRFFFVGFASEFSLRVLAAEVERRGHPVVALDLSDIPIAQAPVPPGDGPLVVVSSQHLFMTGGAYDEYTTLAPGYASAQAIAAGFGADLLVYVPHDLQDPLLPHEVTFLPAYDIFAAPTDDYWWANAFTRTVTTGWVGTLRKPEPKPVPAELARGIFFTSELALLRHLGGPEYFLRSYHCLLDTGIAVKFQNWPGLDDYKELLAANGYRVIPTETPVGEILRAVPLVVSNGPSSVLTEAALYGHQPIVVLSPEFEAIVGDSLTDLDLVVCRDDDYPDAVRTVRPVERRDPSFDVDLLLATIESLLAERIAH